MKLLLFAFVLVLRVSFLWSNPVVYTPWGPIQGITNVAKDWTPFHAFLGIPYALPPVGDLRFAKPVPYPEVNTTFNATAFGPSCIHPIINETIGDEDCLTLNIFTPASHDFSYNLAVMIWIHGGDFLGGSAAVDASPIVTVGNVIFVTVQYRIGPFGFLSTEDDNAKGNYGLWDQHLAIMWVKENIRAFGGDPDKITLAGHFAGSASVGFQALYPGSRDLFKRTIMQSGSVTSFWSIKRNPLPETQELARRLNCLSSGHANSNRHMVKCLRNVPADILAKNSWPMRTNLALALVDMYFVPTVDGDFIPDDPHKLIASPAYLSRIGFQDLDCMIGLNSYEGGNIFNFASEIDQIFQLSLEQAVHGSRFYRNVFVPSLFDQYFGNYSTSMVNTLFTEYAGQGTHSHIGSETVMNTWGDPGFVVPGVQFATAHSNLTAAGKTYLYLFSHNPPLPQPNPVKGAINGQDQIYMFGLSSDFWQGSAGNTSQDVVNSELELSKTSIRIITDFAKLGDPNTAVKGHLSGGWPEFDPSTQQYMILDVNLTVSNHLFQNRVSLWTKVLPRLLKNWQNHGHHVPIGSRQTTANHHYVLPDGVFG